MADAVGNVEVAATIYRHTMRLVKLGAGGGVAVTTVAGRTIAGYSGDGAAAVHLADVARDTGDVEVAAAIHRHAIWVVELGAGSEAAVAAVADCTIAGDSGDGTAAIHLADAVVEGVGDIEVAAVVHGHARRSIQLGAGGGAAVATIAARTIAGDGADGAAAIYLANAVVKAVSNVEVAAAVHGHAYRVSKLGVGGGAAVAALAARTIAGDGVDGAAAIHLANAVVIAVGDVEVAAVVHGHAPRDIKLGVRGGAAVPTSAARTVASDGEDGAGAVYLADAVVKGVGNVEVTTAIYHNISRIGEVGAGGRDAVSETSAATGHGRDIARCGAGGLGCECC